MGLLIPGRYSYGLGKLCRYRHLICGGGRTQFPSYSNWERAFDHVAKIAAQSIHIMLCYFNGFVYRLSFCSQGQHFDILMDNVDMVYMNIMICWNIIMVMAEEDSDWLGLLSMVFNTTFNNISVTLWRSVLLVDEPEVVI